MEKMGSMVLMDKMDRMVLMVFQWVWVIIQIQFLVIHLVMLLLNTMFTKGGQA